MTSFSTFDSDDSVSTTSTDSDSESTEALSSSAHFRTVSQSSISRHLAGEELPSVDSTPESTFALRPVPGTFQESVSRGVVCDKEGLPKNPIWFRNNWFRRGSVASSWCGRKILAGLQSELAEQTDDSTLPCFLM